MAETKQKKPDISSVVGGGAWAFASGIVAALVAFLYTPVLIRTLGSELFGVFSLLTAILSYLGLSDAGMGPTSTRFAAKEFESKVEASEAAVIWNSVLITLIPSTVGALLCAYFAPEIIHALKLRIELQSVATEALRIIVWAIIARNLAGTLNTPLVVRLRYKTVGTIAVVSTLFQGILLVAAAFGGGGLLGCVLVYVFASTILLVGQYWQSKRVLPQLQTPSFNSSLIAPMVRDGVAVMVVTLISAILPQVDRVFLARSVSARSVGYYAVAVSLASVVSMVPRALKTVMFPVISRLHVADQNQVAPVYGSILRFSAILLIPLCVVLMFLGETVLRVWAGQEYAANSTSAFQVLVWAAWFLGLTYYPVAILLAVGRSSISARLQVMVTVPYVVSLPLVVARYGLLGAAWASFARALAELVCLLYASRRELRGVFSSKDSWRVTWMLLCVLIAVVALFEAVRLHPYWVRYLALVSWLFLYSLVSWLSLFDTNERAVCKDLLRRIVEKTRGRRIAA